MSKPLEDGESSPPGADDLIRLARLDFGVFAFCCFQSCTMASRWCRLHT
jgi:hypothetical protein